MNKPVRIATTDLDTRHRWVYAYDKDDHQVASLWADRRWRVALCYETGRHGFRLANENERAELDALIADRDMAAAYAVTTPVVKMDDDLELAWREYCEQGWG